MFVDTKRLQNKAKKHPKIDEKTMQKTNAKNTSTNYQTDHKNEVPEPQTSLLSLRKKTSLQFSQTRT